MMAWIMHCYIWCTTGYGFRPLLFLLYINDLPSNLQCTVRLFADDGLLYALLVNPTSHDQLLQDDLYKLEEGQSLWQMRFNHKEFSTMCITLKKNLPPMNFRFCGQALENVTSHPYLGVQFGTKLCWKEHIEFVVKGVNKILGLIRRNLWFCDQKVKLTLFETLVRPKLEYATSVWDRYYKCDIRKLEGVQRAAPPALALSWP